MFSQAMSRMPLPVSPNRTVAMALLWEILNTLATPVFELIVCCRKRATENATVWYVITIPCICNCYNVTACICNCYNLTAERYISREQPPIGTAGLPSSPTGLTNLCVVDGIRQPACAPFCFLLFNGATSYSSKYAQALLGVQLDTLRRLAQSSRDGGGRHVSI